MPAAWDDGENQVRVCYKIGLQLRKPDIKMPNLPGKPLTIECEPSELSKYLIDSRVGIVSVLFTLQKAGSLVTAYFSGGNNFVITTILAVRAETDELVLDFGADTGANQRALQAKRITFVTVHDRIKIQFYTGSLSKVNFDGRDAFSTPLPSALLRLQRREFFRIATPLVQPLKCLIGPQVPPLSVPAEASIVDLSCGGIGIIDSSDPSAIETDACFLGCRIPLPEIGMVTADLRVKSIFEVNLKNGNRHKHIGCEFVAMPERERAKIQRYINNVERERKNRLGGR